MKRILPLAAAALLAISAVHAQKINETQTLPGLSTQSNQPDEWFTKATAVIDRMQYAFKKDAKLMVSTNARQHTKFTVTSNGYSVGQIQQNGVNNKQLAQFTAVRISRGNTSLIPIANPSVYSSDDYLLQDHGAFGIEYISNANGLRQNFIIDKKLDGTGKVQVLIKIKTSLKIKLTEQAVLIQENGQTVLQYDDLKVWDADKKVLSAKMELLGEDMFAITVDDATASYPITIDPLNHTTEWATSAQGILPSVVGQLAVEAAYGYSLAGLGDVNGDTYDDAAIGAPAMADFISGTGTLSAVGAVFVYYGSPNGLPVAPSVKLQPSTAISGALFGYSISGGDVTGDGKNDIVVGAPLDRITISTGGSGTANGTVGKVYVFNGNGLPVTATTAFATLQLSGNNIVENGVNLSVKALFGLSVSVTDDLNNDGKDDIIVGAPGYAGIKTGLFGTHLLDVQSGAAFVYTTNSSDNSFTQQKLNPPTSSLFGTGLLSSNINGLLFGISVDGAGDYNADGKPDVVVGAPAGINLGSVSALLNGQLLQGSALVYFGNGAGVNNTSGVTLTASSGLITNLSGTLSNIVNLFGFCVKGLRSADGTHNGSIAVGAPLGGALTNLLNGLQVKTGTVSIFQQKTASVNGLIIPDQQLVSPRGTNSILNLIQSSLLFGFSIDNAYDINCDGIGDLIIGEPASSGAQLVGANIAGGSAYVFKGNANGSYEALPVWTLNATYEAALGVNVASLTGYSVAGAKLVKGNGTSNRVLVGAPGRTLGFGVGLLNLGNTIGTIFDLLAVNNGTGKSYLLDVKLCPTGNQSSLPLVLRSFDAAVVSGKKVQLNWSVTSETSVGLYVIERSTNAVNWIYVGEKASNGFDRSSEYNAFDENPLKGVSFYRLMQIDKDGGVFYSATRRVSIGERNNELIQVQSPFRQSINMQIFMQAEHSVSIELMDSYGRLLKKYSMKLSQGMHTVKLDNLPVLARGLYFVRINNGNEMLSLPVLKE